MSCRVVPSLAAVGNDIKKPGMTELAYPRTPLKALASLAEMQKEVRAGLGRIHYETRGSVRVNPPARLASIASAIAAISGVT